MMWVNGGVFVIERVGGWLGFGWQGMVCGGRNGPEKWVALSLGLGVIVILDFLHLQIKFACLLFI